MADSFQDYLNSPVGGGGSTSPQSGPSPTPQSLPVPTPRPPSVNGMLNPFKVMGAVNYSLGNWKAGAQDAGKAMDIGVGPFSPFMYPYPGLFPRPKMYSDSGGIVPHPFQAQPPSQPSSAPIDAPIGNLWGPLNPEGGWFSTYNQAPGFSQQPGMKQGVIPPPQGGWTYPTLNSFPFPQRQTGPY